MLSSSGALLFDETDHGGLLLHPKLFVEVDPGIVQLARALLPPVIRQSLQPQRYPPHISVVRNEAGWTPAWKRMAIASSPQTMTFEYDPEPVLGTTYAWLRVFAPDLTTLRLTLGLSPSSEWSRPPGDEECFHCTIGNFKT